MAAVDPRCYTKPYYLAAEDVGHKSYRLLLMAMEKAGVVAVGKLAYRERERLCIIRPFDGILMLQELAYAEQLRPYQDLRPMEYVVSDRELELAGTLIGAMTSESFELGKYHDEYRHALEALIEAKAAGEVLAMPEPGKAPVGDVADALIASLTAAGVKV